MTPATIRRTVVERAAAARTALGRSPELKTPSPKRLTKSKGAAKVKAAALKTDEESAKSSGKPSTSKAKGKGSAKLDSAGNDATKESAPSRPARRTRATSVLAESDNAETNTKAKAAPRDKGKGKQKRVEPLEVVEEEGSPDEVYTQVKTTTMGQGNVEMNEDSDLTSDEDEEPPANWAASEIVDESELIDKVSNTEARNQEPVQPTDPEEEDLDPSVIIPKMNALVQEDIADLKTINQLEDMLKKVDKDIQSILHGCRRERLFRDRLETFLRYCTFNNNSKAKYDEEVSVRNGGALDNGWELDQVWTGGGVVVQWGPDDHRLANEIQEEEYFERDDEEIQKDLDELMTDSDDESESTGQAENSRSVSPAIDLSPSRKRPRDIEEDPAPPARRIRPTEIAN